MVLQQDFCFDVMSPTQRPNRLIRLRLLTKRSGLTLKTHDCKFNELSILVVALDGVIRNTTNVII